MAVGVRPYRDLSQVAAPVHSLGIGHGPANGGSSESNRQQPRGDGLIVAVSRILTCRNRFSEPHRALELQCQQHAAEQGLEFPPCAGHLVYAAV